jgi:hypothetical protein
MVIEKYRISLEHFYEFAEPDKPVTKSDIDPILSVECCCDPNFVPKSIILNNMMDRMKEEVLVRARAEVKP